jgi:hypothetical protein
MNQRFANPKAGSFEDLPFRIFLDTCTVQTIFTYGEYIHDGGVIEPANRIRRIPDGLDNVEALRLCCQVTQRAMFQWFVSDHTWAETERRGRIDQLQWLSEIDQYSRGFEKETGPTPESAALAARLAEPRFGYLGHGDRVLLADAVHLRCDTFLTTERKLPKNAVHIERELGIRVFTPIKYWEKLQPWAGLWW